MNRLNAMKNHTNFWFLITVSPIRLRSGEASTNENKFSSVRFFCYFLPRASAGGIKNNIRFNLLCLFFLLLLATPFGRMHTTH